MKPSFETKKKAFDNFKKRLYRQNLASGLSKTEAKRKAQKTAERTINKFEYKQE